MEEQQVSVIEFTGFETADEVQEFFNEILATYEWKPGHSIAISNLSAKGVEELHKHVFKRGGGEDL